MSEAALKQFAVVQHEPPSELPRAGNGTRFIAAVLDGFFSSVLSGLGLALITKGLHADSFIVKLTWTMVFPFVYTVLPLYASGQTLGKKLMKIRVDNVASPLEGISLWNAVYRELIGKFIGMFCFALGFVSIVRRPDGRAWHDRMAKTRVVSLVEE